MLEVKAPKRYLDIRNTCNDPIRLFLAGSIEMGTAEKWQDKVVASLKDKNVVIFNPRRDDWDSSWVQSIDNPQFKEQVEWELDYLERANVVLFYFDPNTKSPITLLELGLVDKNKPVVVCCPKGFWRRGNVEIVCKKYDLIFCENLDEALFNLF